MISGNTLGSRIVLDSGIHDVIVLPRLSCRLPIATRVTVDKNCDHVTSSILRFGKISPTCFIAMPKFTPVAAKIDVVRQKTIGAYLATIYSDNDYNIVIENNTDYFNCYLSDSDVDIALLCKNGYNLICVRNDKTLILLDESLQLIFSNQNCEYVLSENGFDIKLIRCGIIMRAIEEKYDYLGNLLSRNVSYPSGVSYPAQLWSYAFMEAVICGDYTFAQQFLHSEIADSIYDLVKFIGTPVEIVVDELLPFSEHCIFVRYANDYKMFNFTRKDDKIFDVIEN